MNTLELKHCPTCNIDLPIGEFGVCRARKDGRNLYCMSCIRTRQSANRKNQKEYKEAKKKRQVNAYFEIEAPQYPVEVIRKLSPVEKVREAIYRGCRSQAEIRTETGLFKDEIGDALANLLLWTEEIKTRVVDDVRIYLPNRNQAKPSISYPASASLVEIARKNCGPVMKGEKQIRRVA